MRPSAAYADLIVDGTSSLDWSLEQVLSQLHKRQLIASEARKGVPVKRP